MNAIKINDNTLDRLGVYFVYHNVHQKHGITFETFVDRWQRGILEL